MFSLIKELENKIENINLVIKKKERKKDGNYLIPLRHIYFQNIIALFKQFFVHAFEHFSPKSFSKLFHLLSLHK